MKLYTKIISWVSGFYEYRSCNDGCCLKRPQPLSIFVPSVNGWWLVEAQTRSKLPRVLQLQVSSLRVADAAAVALACTRSIFRCEIWWLQVNKHIHLPIHTRAVSLVWSEREWAPIITYIHKSKYRGREMLPTLTTPGSSPTGSYAYSLITRSPD